MKRLRRIRRSLAIAAGAGTWALALGCSRGGATKPSPLAAAKAADSSRSPAAGAPADHPARSLPVPLPPGPWRSLIIGGGSTPESTEVSLEQDVALSQRTLPAPSVALFAGGSGSLSVREIDPAPPSDPILVELGALFHPRAGRQSRYRAPRLHAERATIGNVESTLTRALTEGTDALLLHVAAHGDQGATPRQNLFGLWGGGTMTVSRLAELHEQHPRPLRVVVTSCFSGGFAELAFAKADEHAGPSRSPRCGLFAGTWDRETSGCDANPDRREQESYNLHFVHALRNTDRAGKPLPPELGDFDHDGHISLFEAHTRARIAAVSLDVPTTTSERWLRFVERRSAPVDTQLLPEDAAVVTQLGEALGLRDEAAVEKRWNDLDRRLGDLDDTMTDAENAQGIREAELGARLLERWPVLDDAFHPAFAQTLATSRAAIRTVLEASEEAKAVEEARRKADAIDEELSTLEVEEARVLRLKRAYETLHLAAALTRRGGRAAEYYRTLLACERTVP